MKSHTKFFSCLVGYFYASGFFKIYKELEDVEKIRVLVGINTNQQTFDMLLLPRISWGSVVACQRTLNLATEMNTPGAEFQLFHQQICLHQAFDFFLISCIALVQKHFQELGSILSALNTVLPAYHHRVLLQHIWRSRLSLEPKLPPEAWH